MSRTAVEDDGRIFPFSNTGFIYANSFTWNWIFCEYKRNKMDGWMDVSDTLQLTATVSHRWHFCHFVTNSWLLRSGTQTHHLSPCACVCASGRASEGVNHTAPCSKTVVFFHSLIQPWISSTEVIKSNANKRDRLKRWYVMERWKYFFTFHI